MERAVIKKKVCLLGAFGVGKTSLVRKFVHSIFDDTYRSTIGVKIDKKVVCVGDHEVVMVIWDVAGEEEFFQIPDSYVKGAHGILFVADGTREETLTTLHAIRERFRESVGALPEVILLNKKDLVDQWALGDDVESSFADQGVRCMRTSAMDGRNVEAAFVSMAMQLIQHDDG
jgi:small GTP-binding protein